MTYCTCHSEASLYKGLAGKGSFVPYTVEPLYKRQAGDGSFVPYTVESLYKGQAGEGSFVPYTVEHFYKRTGLRDNNSREVEIYICPCSDVVLALSVVPLNCECV